jgi:hypothetical protein
MIAGRLQLNSEGPGDEREGAAKVGKGQECGRG